MPQDFHLEENVKNIQYLKLSTPCPTCLQHKIKELLEGPKYETAFSTVFRAACRWTDLKGSKHLDLWMLAITYKEPFTVEVHHYRSCYHTYTLWVGSVTSWVVISNTAWGSRKTILRRTLYSHPKQTPIKSTSIANDKHCIMMNHSMFSHGISLVNDLTNNQHSSREIGCDHLYMQSQMALGNFFSLLITLQW